MGRKIVIFLRQFPTRFRSLKPAQITLFGFLLLILLGTGLLCLPCATKDGAGASFLTALFTATSATCVTGLSLVDTGTFWSGFGQCVILVLIQIGGLGFMTISSVFLFALRKKIGLQQRMVLASALSGDDMQDIIGLVRNILRGTFAVEAIGAAFLTARFCKNFNFFTALRYGVFHAISAFCNAGFDILGDTAYGGSLCRYGEDAVINFTLMALIIIGGLGFSVWGDIRRKKCFSALRLYTKLVIICTVVLIFGGAALFAALEWSNPDTIGSFSVSGKLLAALFQSVTLRTAGFTTINQGGLRDVSRVLCDILMFIGGSSGSTAGGVKTVTVFIVFLAVTASARGSEQIIVGKRAVSHRTAANAQAIFILALMLAMAGAAAICCFDGVSFGSAIYETISALCTVGLTTGITATLCSASQILLILFMFFGRVGFMTVTIGLAAKPRASAQSKFAETDFMIG